ncbi:MAG: GNAT family N-acetyltransferase [Bacteroidota bacterium]
MIIKKAKPQDARRISYLIRQNTDKVADNPYSEAQKKAWKQANTPGKIAKSMQQKTIWCAWEKGRLMGTIARKGNELMGLYVSHTQRGKGIGGQLLAHLEAQARAAGITDLFLYATPSGEVFYQSRGFIAVEKASVWVNGVEFRETKMTKLL